ncbi:MAG: molybdopterin-dependent oxidoreductase [Spirochaetota bacterium]|nr:molybdopterin-dependent oxidoreductase [Spirochaetota bacterium]
MDEINFSIDGQRVKGYSGNTIIEVALKYNIPIPTLCHDPFLDSIGACRICLVENEERGNLIAACVTTISKDLSILTNTEKVLETRKVIVKLMLASHPDSCIVCEKGNRCKLRQIAADLGIGLVEYYPMPHYSGTQEVNSFLLRDLSKCILCAKCIRADQELVVEGAIDYIDRGFEARPSTLTDGPLESSGCTFCGTCEEVCPTGALFKKDNRSLGTHNKRVATTCSFCGCGCSFWLEVAKNQVVGVRPGISGSVNGKTLCVKGRFGFDHINHPERLNNPLIRKEDALVEASWDEALEIASKEIKNINQKTKGEQSLAIITGPHCTNEEAYLTNEFATNVLKTNYVACMSSSYIFNLIEGMEDSCGFAGPTATIEDIEEAEVILLIGANPTETAPIVGYSIKRCVRRRQTNLIVIDPVEIQLSKFACLWLRPTIGSDGILLSAILRLMIEHQNYKEALDDERIQILKNIKNLSLDIDIIERETGVTSESLFKAVDIFISSKKRAIVFGNGIIQQPNGKELVKILCSISQLTQEETIIFPLVKESNVIGCYHLGLIKSEMPERVFKEILRGNIKGLWIMGDDPMTSLPGNGEIQRALDKLDLLIVSDTFLSNTGEKAHVVFPSVTFAEKSGTITNMEGRVQRIRPAIECVNNSISDYLTILNIAKLLGSSFSYKSELEVTEEIINRVPLYSKMNMNNEDDGYFSYLLPVSSLKGKASLFIPGEITSPLDKDDKYPYTLMLGSILKHLGTGYQTKHSPRLCGDIEEGYVEINPKDASREDIKDRDIVKLISIAGEKRIRAHLTQKIPMGCLFLPLPFTEGSNIFTNISNGNTQKTINVKIERTII